MLKYTIITLKATHTFVGYCFEDGGFIPDPNTALAAKDHLGNPVIACFEEELTFDDAWLLRQRYIDVDGEIDDLDEYREFLIGEVGFDSETADAIVTLESIR